MGTTPLHTHQHTLAFAAVDHGGQLALCKGGVDLVIGAGPRWIDVAANGRLKERLPLVVGGWGWWLGLVVGSVLDCKVCSWYCPLIHL